LSSEASRLDNSLAKVVAEQRYVGKFRSRSSAPCRIQAAAALSTSSARRARVTSASPISIRFTAMELIRSSQKAIGRSRRRIRLRAKARFDWQRARLPENRGLTAFVARLIAIRQSHGVFRPPHFLHGHEQIAPGVLDIEWFDERGQRLSYGDWGNPQGRALIMALAGSSNGRREYAAVMMNASESTLDFTLPQNFRWRLVVDSAEPEKAEQDLPEGQYSLQDRSAAIAIAILDRKRKEAAT